VVIKKNSNEKHTVRGRVSGLQLVSRGGIELSQQLQNNCKKRIRL
jgi:hypothetical protein